jgi:tetraacyldisaccharide 4'-kinase
MPLLALAGIARPHAFFDMLANAGLTLSRTLALADHFDFDSIDIAAFQGYQVLCTEKDAVKLWAYLPQALAVPLIQVLDAQFLQALDRQTQNYFDQKLSSRDGHPIN